MTVTVPKIRSAAVMDVDISVCLHIKVFVILMCGPACFHVCVVVFFFFFFIGHFVIVFLLCSCQQDQQSQECVQKTMLK